MTHRSRVHTVLTELYEKIVTSPSQSAYLIDVYLDGTNKSIIKNPVDAILRQVLIDNKYMASEIKGDISKDKKITDFLNTMTKEIEQTQVNQVPTSRRLY